MADVPFTTYAFVATGSPTARTLLDRLINIINVKDFGATGNGVTDDWAAIMAAYNNGKVTLVTSAPSSGNVLTFSSVPATIAGAMYAIDVTNPSKINGALVLATTSTTVTLSGITGTVNAGETITFNRIHRGTIFFPPGTYLVSQAINFYEPGVSVGFLGVMGASTVTGNFSDYIFKRHDDSDPNYSGYSGYHVVEKLTVTNTHATGGGIRMGGCVGAAIRDCNVTANKGISTANTNELASLEITIENCTLSPGSNSSGSIGLLLFADGPAINCYVNGFAKGAISSWGNQGGQVFEGCRFENCGIGYQPGTKPDGSTGGGGGFIAEGCYFKNCGTAIYMTSSGGTFRGILIEGTNGQAPGSTNPQYGIYIPQGFAGACVWEGVVVNGQFDLYGIFIGGNELTPVKSNMFGVSSVNFGSGSAWGSGASPVANLSNAPFTGYDGCNIRSVTTTNQLLLFTPITSLTCPSNTVTLTWAFGNLGPLTGQTFDIRVSGVSVGGYNGTFQGTITGTNTLTYTVVGPLANDSSGNIVINYKDLSEGDSFDISDSNSSTWAGTVTGGGSTHAKVRWDGTDLTVVGK